MVYLLIRHMVNDYARWKPIFDEHGANRKASGSKGGQLFRSVDNQNEIILIVEYDDLTKAREFTQSDDLKRAMQKAGVADKPDVYFLEKVEDIIA